MDWHSLPALGLWVTVAARLGASEQQGWGRPGHHSICFWCPGDFEPISLQRICPLPGSLWPGARDCDTWPDGCPKTSWPRIHERCCVGLWSSRSWLRSSEIASAAGYPRVSAVKLQVALSREEGRLR